MKVVSCRRATSEQNAAFVATRILKAVELLQAQPEMGVPGRVLGTRELVVPETPYVSRVRRSRLELIAGISRYRRPSRDG